MLKKDNDVKWSKEACNSFHAVNLTLAIAPVLITDYSNDFMIFSFASFDIVADVLLQKNVEGLEQPISFFSRALRDAEKKYDIMEK